MAIISKGIELFHKWDGGTEGAVLSGNNFDSSFGSRFYGLQEVGELSGMKGGTSRDQIEVTTLSDDEHKFVDGIKAQSEQAAVTFKFLYDAELFSFIQRLSDKEQELISSGEKKKLGTYRVRIPIVPNNFATFEMKATITDLKLDGAGVNGALTMSVSLTPYEAINYLTSEAGLE